MQFKALKGKTMKMNKRINEHVRVYLVVDIVKLYLSLNYLWIGSSYYLKQSKHTHTHTIRHIYEVSWSIENEVYTYGGDKQTLNWSFSVQF